MPDSDVRIRTGFVFYEGNLQIDATRGYIARIDCSACDSAMLLDTLCQALGFPDYFGSNWNALSDCLRDLSWLSEYHVIIIHDCLPSLPEGDLKEYLDVHRECVASWKPGDNHALVVAFPKSVEATILGALRVRE